jgi:hypothetical protein
MATLLPNGRQVFNDANGQPLVGGSVFMYIPLSENFKDTWQDADQSILNTNPIILDGLGSAVIYGSGTYRQQVFNADGDLIWDQLTASTDSGGLAWGGQSTGTANAQVIAASSFSGQDGQAVAFIAGDTNTSALTITPGSGSPAIAVLKDTLGGPTPLTGAEVTEQNAVLMIYEASRGAFHLVAYPLSSGTSALTNIPGGSTINLGTISSFNANVTGSGWTATSFGSAAAVTAPIYYITFAGTGTLTDSSALILPGGENISVAAGDTAAAMYLGSGNWRVLWYTPAAVAPSTGYRYTGTQVFTGSGTYTPTVGTRYIRARLWGGGGGGGGVDPASTDAAGGGGGGQGAYTEYNATVPAAQTVTIGAGGTAGASTGTSGGTGGATSLGALATAPGGLGGTGADNTVSKAVTALAGGAGGAPGTGTIAFAGETGGAGIGVDNNAGDYGAAGGAGGGIGGGKGGTITTTSTGGSSAGSAGRNYGAGGGGGAAVDAAGTAAGGAGFAGFMTIDEYS